MDVKPSTSVSSASSPVGDAADDALPDARPVCRTEVAHGGGDVDVVGEVTVRGCLAQSADGGCQVVLGAAYGVVEGDGGVDERGEPGKAGDGALGVPDDGAVGDVAVGVGVAHEGRDVGVEGGGALVELGEVLVREGEFVVGAERVGEGGDQGEEGLGDGPLARGVVLFCFGPCGFEGGDGTVDIAVGPQDVSQDAVVAALPAQGGDGGQGGGENTPDAGEVGQAAAGTRGEPTVGVGDSARSAPAAPSPASIPSAGGLRQASEVPRITSESREGFCKWRHAET
ncbi:hypothetical protein [Streptomyces sp. Inha503]|uniref:hypothetical protein n=1 Tax=Streptomyces sp. Inha503 TaxID=3383314 RepID=UPI0039A3984A